MKLRQPEEESATGRHVFLSLSPLSRCQTQLDAQAAGTDERGRHGVSYSTPCLPPHSPSRAALAQSDKNIDRPL
jgi:hypothetical protein